MSEEVSSSEGNAISSQEFSDMEYGERKKEGGGPFGIFRKKPQAQSHEVTGAAQESSPDSVVQLSVRLERLSGRLEVLEDTKKDLEGRFTDTSEKIGELRSSLMDRDRTFGEAMAKFDRVSSSMESLEPDKLRKDLEKKEQQIEQNHGEVESLEERMSMVLKKQKEISEVLDQLKGMRELVSVAEDIEKKINIIEGLKSDTEKVYGKFESRLYDMNDTLGSLKGNLVKISSNEETIKELMRTVDGLALKVEKSVTKDDINTVQKILEEKVSDIKFDTESRFAKVLEAFKVFDETSGEKGFRSLSRKIEDLSGSFSDYKKDAQARLSRVESLEEEMKSLKEGFSQKTLLGLEEIMQSGGGNMESTVLGEIKGLLKEEEFKNNNRLADLELKILELSKSYDARREKPAAKDPKASMVSSRVPDRAAVNTAPQQPRAVVENNQVLRSSSSQDYFQDINSLVNEVYFFLDAKNYKNAKLSFIKLLSVYERQETSNPFVLAKITDLHKRLKEITG